MPLVNKTRKSKAPGASRGPFSCLKLSGAGGFEPPTTGFGVLGWIRFPVDIGMMMTASIALGIAVDGTFHFLVRYE